MQKLWVVLKVSLTRPWVWMMLPMVFLQVLPLLQFAPKNPINDYRNAIPVFDQPDVVATSAIDLGEFARKHELERIEGLVCRDIPGELSFDDQGMPQSIRPSIVNAGYIISSGNWPILDQTPRLKSLVLQPPNSLTAEGWQRISRLTQLESLELESLGQATADQPLIEQHLSTALTALPNLRQLNLNNFGGRYDWKLPPLARLEYLILGFNTQMESNLETLAQSSPNLQTLVLHTYDNFNYTDRMISSILRMKSLRRLILCSSSQVDAWRETQRQVEDLRERIPGVNVERGVYSPNRVILHLFLAIVAGFLPFIAWFQTGLKMSQPLAAVIPGHRGPHIFWPIAISIASSAVMIGFSVRAGTYWPAAVSLAAMESMLVAAILPGHDLTPRWRLMLQYVTVTDVIGVVFCVVLALAAPYYADSYLMGDYPVITVALMFWLLIAGVWKVWRTTRLHRILAESGMPGIPGLSMGMQQIMDQPYKPAPGWSVAKWQLQHLEGTLDRKIARMDRSNWVDMLRKASPSNPGIWIGMTVMIVGFVVFRQFAPAAPRKALTSSPVIALGVWQAMMMMFMFNIMMWISRRSVIVHEFLRPISRPLYYRHLRLAIFHDLKLALLFGLVGGLYSSYLANQHSLPALTIVNAVLSAVGALAWLHGWVTLAVIGKRLWLHATLGLVTSGLMFGAAAASIVLTFSHDSNPMLASALSLGLVLAGGAMQWGISRKLPDWELA